MATRRDTQTGLTKSPEPIEVMPSGSCTDKHRQWCRPSAAKVWTMGLVIGPESLHSKGLMKDVMIGSPTCGDKLGALEPR